MSRELWLIRHGETEWTLSGQHTGRTNIDLTVRGRVEAEKLREILAGHKFAKVLVSPAKRAQETCRISGLLEHAEIDTNLQEWDYGLYEGRTSVEIRAERPGWSIWTQDVPGGETLEQVAERAQAVITRAVGADGDAALFSHGHFLRVLGACWLGLPPQSGCLFALNTASVSVLGYEGDNRVIRSWNHVCGM